MCTFKELFERPAHVIEGHLEGVLCKDVHEARAAALAGAHFLAHTRRCSRRAELAALCARVSMPVFARGISLERAFAAGASGINALAD